MNRYDLQAIVDRRDQEKMEKAEYIDRENFFRELHLSETTGTHGEMGVYSSIENIRMYCKCWVSYQNSRNHNSNSKAHWDEHTTTDYFGDCTQTFLGFQDDDLIWEVDCYIGGEIETD